jgi:hypothetical protein
MRRVGFPDTRARDDNSDRVPRPTSSAGARAPLAAATGSEPRPFRSRRQCSARNGLDLGRESCVTRYKRPRSLFRSKRLFHEPIVPIDQARSITTGCTAEKISIDRLSSKDRSLQHHRGACSRHCQRQAARQDRLHPLLLRRHRPQGVAGAVRRHRAARVRPPWQPLNAFAGEHLRSLVARDPGAEDRLDLVGTANTVHPSRAQLMGPVAAHSLEPESTALASGAVLALPACRPTKPLPGDTWPARTS